jgi:hypothetical protein
VRQEQAGRLILLAFALALDACQPVPERAATACPPELPAASADPCGRRASPAYVPLAAPTVSASLPELPALPDRPEREGDAYTVWGIKKALRAPGGESKLAALDVVVVGHVVSTNFAEAPACALHLAGKADPPGCSAPVPSFYLADDPADPRWRIKVMGFASSWASMFTARKREKAGGARPYIDAIWGRTVPRPLPSKGAKMRIVGHVSRSFTMSSSGVESNPGGVVTYSSGSYLSQARDPAVLGSPAAGRNGRSPLPPGTGHR